MRPVATGQASLFLHTPHSLLAPATYSAFRHKKVIVNGCKKIFESRGAQSSNSIVVCESNLPALPKFSISTSADLPHQQLHACAPKEKLAPSFSASSTSLFGDQDGILHGMHIYP